MQEKIVELSGKQRLAAIFVAEDDLPDGAIAAQIGINPITLWRWKQLPSFMAAVSAHIERLSTELQKFHIARREKRVARYQERWNALQQVRRERAADAEMASVPGGQTGLMVRTYKSVGHGENAYVVSEYAVDTGALAAEAALEKQAAIEAGQWSEKTETAIEQNTVFTIRFDRADEDNRVPPPLDV